MKIDKYKEAEKICVDIKNICKTFGNRDAGSEGERKAARYFSDGLSACADEVKIEEFKLNPSAFTGWIVLSVTSVLLGIAAYFLSAFISILLMLVALIPFLGEYLFYKRMLDPLYPEKISQNVTAVKKCKETPKKRLYLVANIDSPYENGVKYRFGGIMFLCVIALDVVAMIYFTSLSIARWVFVGGVGAGIASGALLYAGLAGLIFLFPLFSSYFTISKKVVTDGANRNLTGCFIATKALCAIKDIELQNIEIGVILTGGSASGLRGAKAWCEAHKDEIDAENTVFIALNTLRELNSLNVNSREMNGIVKNDKDTQKLVLDSAKAIGVKCTNHAIPFDASDAAAFSQAGFKGASISAINVKLPDYYNTRYDSYDNLSSECIAEAYALTIEIIKNFAPDEPQLGDIVFNTQEEATEVSDEEIQPIFAVSTEDSDTI